MQTYFVTKSTKKVKTEKLKKYGTVKNSKTFFDTNFLGSVFLLRQVYIFEISIKILDFFAPNMTYLKKKVFIF
jgi:hypothetical protein